MNVLSFSHLQSLFLLQLQDGPRTMRQVSDGLNANPYRESVSRQAFSKLAARLEKAGFISKRNKGRESSVSLTSQGRRQLDAVLSFCRYVPTA